MPDVRYASDTPVGLLEPGMDELSESDQPRTSVDDEVQAMEDAVLAQTRGNQLMAKGQMGQTRIDYRRYMKRFRGTYIEPDDNSIFSNVNLSKMAKLIRQYAAQLMSQVIPDKTMLDFFRVTPQVDPDNPMPPDMAEQYCQMVEEAVRADLRDGKFVALTAEQIQDMLITGNCWGLLCYDFVMNHKFMNVPNPEYDPSKPPELNVKSVPVLHDDGKIQLDDNDQPMFTKTVISPTVTVRQAFREKDSPCVRYLNPLNVYVSQLDMNDGAAACDAVWIYDTVHKSDLYADDIEHGGELYQNMDEIRKLKPNILTSEIDGYDSRSSTDRQQYLTASPNNSLALKLKRITGFFRMDWDEIMDGKEISPEGKKAFFDKWNCDPQKRTDWNTWVVEILEEKVLARCQPIAFFEDKIPVVHGRLFPSSGRTLGDGLYSVGEKMEHIYNAFVRYELEGTLRSVRPVWGIVKEEIDAIFWQEIQGVLNYKPNMVIPLAGRGANIDRAIQPLAANAVGVQMASQAKEYCERQMAELSEMPAVKQGTDSGGNTATEVAKMSANADIVQDHVAQMFEIEFIQAELKGLIQLHHQFTLEERTVTRRNEAAQFEAFPIKPEIWLHGYDVDLLGYRSTGNAAVRAYNLDKYANFLAMAEKGGSLSVNYPELCVEIGKALQIRDAKRMIGPPPPRPRRFRQKQMSTWRLRPKCSPAA